MQIAATAAEAFERYEIALKTGALIQDSWHKEQDGRQLACALGVLGTELGSASDCPATVMPRWLAQMVPWFFDNQEPEDAYTWGLAFYAELRRLDGKVPFTVVHDWHATSTTVLAIEVSEKRNRKPEVHVVLQALHKRAATGETIKRDDWYAALKPAFFDANAYADADAYANAYADAYAKADADAYAKAYADAYAYAYANAYANDYAKAYADAYAYAYAYANAYADAKQAVIKRLADGMLDCLRRAPAQEASQ